MAIPTITHAAPLPGNNGPKTPPSGGGGLPLPATTSDGTSLWLRILNVKVLFNATAIVYQGTKIFVLDKLLVREVYRIIKLLKKIFALTEDGKRRFEFAALKTDQKARHILLKLTHNSLNVISGIYELITDNAISKMAYEALGFGANFQPFSDNLMQGVETFLKPVALLTMASKVSHLYLEVRKVYLLDSSASFAKKRDTWILFGKAALDFGIECARWTLYFVGLTTASTYMISASLASLGLLSDCIGLYKTLSPAAENAEARPQEMVIVPYHQVPY